MRALAIAALTICLAGCSRTPETPVGKQVAIEGKRATYLASINIPLRPGERLSSFSFDTWGVDVLAVCQIPPGWRITAGRSAAPDGVIAGEASHGVTWLGDMASLENLALVGLYLPVQKADEGPVPATFRGKADLESADTSRPVTLTHANVRLAPARQCPVVPK